MASTNFCHLHLRSDFVKNTVEGKGARKLRENNFFSDLFNGFKPTRNLMKLFDLKLQVFRWQP